MQVQIWFVPIQKKWEHFYLSMLFSFDYLKKRKRNYFTLINAKNGTNCIHFNKKCATTHHFLPLCIKKKLINNLTFILKILFIMLHSSLSYPRLYQFVWFIRPPCFARVMKFVPINQSQKKTARTKWRLFIHDI